MFHWNLKQENVFIGSIKKWFSWHVRARAKTCFENLREDVDVPVIAKPCACSIKSWHDFRRAFHLKRKALLAGWTCQWYPGYSNFFFFQDWIASWNSCFLIFSTFVVGTVQWARSKLSCYSKFSVISSGKLWNVRLKNGFMFPWQFWGKHILDVIISISPVAPFELLSVVTLIWFSFFIRLT